MIFTIVFLYVGLFIISPGLLLKPNIVFLGVTPGGLSTLIHRVSRCYTGWVVYVKSIHRVSRCYTGWVVYVKPYIMFLGVTPGGSSTFHFIYYGNLNFKNHLIKHKR